MPLVPVECVHRLIRLGLEVTIGEESVKTPTGFLFKIIEERQIVHGDVQRSVELIAKAHYDQSLILQDLF